MRCFLTITVLSLLFACTSRLPPCGPCQDGLEAVIISSPSDNLYHEFLADTFEDGTPVESIETILDKESGQYYLVREGHAKGKDCRTTKTPLYETKDGYLYLRRNGVSESCSGKNCSHCAFKQGGGCDCVNSTNVCEHTIVRNALLIKR